MVPQNVPHNAQQHRTQHPPSATTPGAAPFLFSLDPSAAAKQMAALNAASQARNASRSAPSIAGGTSSGPHLGGISPGHNTNNHDTLLQSGAFVDNQAMSMPRPTPPTGPPNPSVKQRQRNFLTGLASMMASRNTPLPPALTGVPYPPNYDQNKPHWQGIDTSQTEVGIFRLAGKDVDLFKLWGAVFQAGGGAKLTATNGWGMLLAPFDLPEQMANKNGGTSPTASILAKYYNAILQPFEDLYKRNISEQQRKLAARHQGLPPGSQPPINSTLGTGSGNGIAGMQPSAAASNTTINGPSQLATPLTPLQQSSSSTSSVNQLDQNTQPQATFLPDDTTPAAQTPAVPVSDMDNGDTLGTKRKLETESDMSKRSRQKTDTQPTDKVMGHERTASGASQAQATRRKIEYVPYARDVETYGGRDLRALDAEIASIPQRRPWRDHNDWGCVEIEALTMFLRSRISKEVSYALTTFTLLSTMRGQQAGTGFPVGQCSDLFNDVLDLLEDVAFNEVDDADSPDDDGSIITHCDLVNTIQAVEGDPFAALRSHQGSKDPELGPKQRPGNIILVIMNIIRNLSTIKDNLDFLARHDRLLHLLLRLCSLTRTPEAPYLRASSPVLSLSDLATVRKDTLYTLSGISSYVQLTSDTPSDEMRRSVRRAFRLVASYLIDKSEAISPMACFQLSGPSKHGLPIPPSLADLALEVFTRLTLHDANRYVFSTAISDESIYCLFEALIHRLPISDADFMLVGHEMWLSYLEKIVLALYSLAFLSPPHLKVKIKADRNLGFSKIMLRMINKFLLSPAAESRAWFTTCARRTIETMKNIDDAENSFETPKSTLPPLSFGMGYGDVGENCIDQGTGLLGGHRDVAYDMMMMREVDDLMFAELDSLARVQSS